MTDQETYGDPLSRPFWQGAQEGRLLVQQCESCGHHQFYARPMCLSCRGDQLTWVASAGTAVVHSVTTVRMTPAGTEPYQVALVDLAEGPRFLARIDGQPVAIGDAVHVGWQPREDLPPMPVFVRDDAGENDGLS